MMHKSLPILFLQVLFCALWLGACDAGDSALTAQPAEVTDLPLQQPTALPTSTSIPTPQTVVTVEKAAFYAAPDNLLSERLAELPLGTVLTPLGLFGDFLKARAVVDGVMQEGYLYAGWAAPLDSSLPQLSAEQVLPIRENALAWNGWDFSYQSMRAGVRGGVLKGSSQADYLTLFNEAQPVRLAEPLAIIVQAQGGGVVDEIVLAGRLQTGAAEWWKGIRRLDIMILNQNAGEKLQVYYLDGTNDSGVAWWDLKAMPADGLFYLTFLDVEGKKFTLTDSQGSPLTASGQACELPSALFPDGVAYLGFNVTPRSNIEISQYQVLRRASGQFANTASLAQTASVYLAEGGVLSGEMEKLRAATQMRLLGTAGDLAWVQWDAEAGGTRSGLMGLSMLEKPMIEPIPAGMDVPWLVTQNGLLLDSWDGVSWESGAMILDGGSAGGRAVLTGTLACPGACGLHLQVEADGAAAGIELAGAVNPPVTLQIQNGDMLVLQRAEQTLEVGVLPADGELELRLGEQSLRLYTGDRTLLASLELPGLALEGGVQVSLLADTQARLQVNEMSVLAAPEGDYDRFLEQAASSLGPPQPVITAENAAGLTLVKRWGKGVASWAAWSPDGSTAALMVYNEDAIDSGGMIYFYESGSLQLISTFDKQPDEVFAGYLPDGQAIAIVRGSDIRIMDVRSGKLQKTLSGVIQIPDTYQYRIPFSSDGALAAWIGLDGNIHVYRVSNWTELYTLPRGEGEDMFLKVISISPDNTRLAAGRASSDWRHFRLQIWDLTGGRVLRDLPLPGSMPQFSPDWQYYIHFTYSDGYAYHVVRMDDFSEILSATSDSGGLIAPDGSLFVLANRVYRFADLSAVDHYPDFYGSNFSPDGKYLAGTSENGALEIWEVGAHTLFGKIEGFESYSVFDSLALSPDGKWMVTGGSPLTIRDMTDGSIEEASPSGDINHVGEIRFSADGSRMVLKASCKSQVYSVNSWELLRSFGDCGPDLYTNNPAISADGSLVAVTENYWVRTYQVVDGEKVGEFFLGEADMETRPSRLAFSPDMRLLAAGGEDGSVWVYDLQQKSLVFQPGADGIPDGWSSPRIHSLVYSPQGDLLVAVSGLGLRIWNTASGELVFTAPSSDKYYFNSDIEFSPDGALVLIGFGKRRFNEGLNEAYTLIYQVDGWKLVHALQDLPDATSSSTGHFSADGRSIFVVSLGTVSFYGITSDLAPIYPDSEQESLLVPLWDAGACIDIPYATLEDSGLILWSCHGDPNQRWRMAPAAEGAVNLVSVLSDKCLAPAGSLEEGVRVQQTTCDGSQAQQWLAVPVGPQYYQFQTGDGKWCLAAEYVKDSSPILVLKACASSFDQVWQWKTP